MTAKVRSLTLLMILLLTLLAASALGCAARIESISREAYRLPELKGKSIEIDGVALMPVIILRQSATDKPEDGGIKQAEAPYAPKPKISGDTNDLTDMALGDGLRVGLSELLTNNLIARRPGIKLISPSDVLKKLNDAGMSADFLKFYREYPYVGLNSEMLHKIGAAMGCRYLFVSQAVVSEFKSEASFIFIWTFGRRSVQRSVRISSHLWDICSGVQVWEGFGVGYNNLTAYDEAPLTLEIASQAVESMLDNIAPVLKKEK